MRRSLIIQKPIIMLLMANIIGFSLLFLYKQPYDYRILIVGLSISIACILSYTLLKYFSLGDEYLFLTISMLSSIGVIMLYRLNQELGLKQIIWLLFGILLFFAAYFIYSKIAFWNRLMYFYFSVAMILFLSTLLLGKNIKGATNWIVIAGHSIQPAEFIKILFIFFIASYYTHPESIKPINIRIFKKYITIKSQYIFMVLSYIFMGFLVLQKEWGTALLFFLIYFALLYSFERSKTVLLVNTLPAIIGGIGGYLLVYHIKVRIETWLNPWKDITNKGYQITQSLFAIGAGDFFGRGIGLGNPEFIPEVHTDFIFSAICEEMGILGGVAVVLLFFLLTYRGFKIALKTKDVFNQIIALGITVMFGFQTFIIIGGVIKLIPLTGITLPLISYGGSSLVASFIALGILQAIPNIKFANNETNNENKISTLPCIKLLVVMCFLFLSIIGYLTYFELQIKDNIMTNAFNRRQWAQEDNTLRGSILDRNGTVLASSKMENEKQVRIYPYGPLYSHVIGYNSRTYGKSLLELYYNKHLLNINEFSVVFDLKDRFSSNEKRGNNLHLSIDHNLQVKAEKLLNNRNGAVVAMNPRTGEILAMVSKPDFDPNASSLSANWNTMVESPEHPFVPRATQGLYVPGSTFKVITSIAAIENGMDIQTFEDNGKIIIDGKEISNSGQKAYGNIDLAEALSVSSNVVFSQLGIELGFDKLKDITGRIGMQEEIPFDIPVSKSRFPYKEMSETDMAAVAMGQGKLQITPLHMAMITSAIANNGVMMKPMLVSQITTPEGSTVLTKKPSVLHQITTPETAAKLKVMMQQVVDKGTGRNAQIKGIKVAGKTGTAENELSIKQENKEHAWFIGFAPLEDPQIAVAVILEYSGSTGGTQAAPIARELMATWLRK